MASQSATARPIIYLGMDVHKDSITIAMLPAGAKAPTRLVWRRGSMCEHSRRRYAARVATSRNGIPEPRMSQLPTNPILAALQRSTL